MICPEDGCGTEMDPREDGEGPFFFCRACGYYEEGKSTNEGEQQ